MPRPSKRNRRRAVLVWRAGLLLALLAVVGCAPTRVLVKPGLPEPVVEKQPYTVGLYLSPKLVHRVHSETLPGGDKWRIDLGAANAALFRSALGGLFKTVVLLHHPRASGVDLVVQPRMQDFQFSTPEQSKTNFFEAWIKYRLRFTTPAGKPLTDVPIVAYGRSPKRFLHSKDAMADAARRAMRDAVAAMVVKLPRESTVQTYLHGKSTVAGGKTASGPGTHQ